MTGVGHESRLRRVLTDGGTAVGFSCALGNAQIAEEFARTGADYVYLDQQHGLTSADTLVEMIRAVSGGGATPLVRVAWNDPGLIGVALDAGAEGVIIPMIDTPEQAVAAVRACRYFPDGQRSWGPVRAVHGLGTDPTWVNSQVLCLVMIESEVGLQNLEAILAVPGVDGVYLGPADLGISLGGAPLAYHEADDPRKDEAIARVREACADRGLVAGVSGDPTTLAAEGFRMITAGMDLSMIRKSLTGMVPGESEKNEVK